MNGRVSTLAVVCLVVVAGCGGGPGPGPGSSTPSAESADGGGTSTPAATPTAIRRTPTTTTATTGSEDTRTRSESAGVEIPVANGSLRFDHERVFVELREMVDRAAQPPRRVVVTSDRILPANVEDRFVRLVLDLRQPVAVSPKPGDGIPAPRFESVARTKYVVVHEFAHKIQYEQVIPSTAVTWTTVEDHQRKRLGLSIVEGGADYVTFRYMLERPGPVPDRLRDPGGAFAEKSVLQRYVDAPYYYGRRYVAARADSPADHWFVYDDPPNTTERLLHPGGGVRTQVRPLSMSVDSDEWTVRAEDTMGEMFVRLALWSGVNRSSARTASTGWGNDRLVRLERGDDRAYVWALRWDDADNATQFRRTFRAFLDARATWENGTWTGENATYDVRAIEPTTVAVVVGPEQFVDTAALTGSNGEITVATGRQSA